MSQQASVSRALSSSFKLPRVIQQLDRNTENIFRVITTGQEMVWRKILTGPGNVREIYFESGKIDILQKSQGKLKEVNMTGLIPLKAERNIWGQHFP